MAPSAIDQKKLFIEGSLKRINDACGALELLRRHLCETSYLQSISRICHKLAGSSGFFNMPAFSQAAVQCERATIDLLKSGSELNAGDIEQLSSQLSAMAQMLKDTPLDEIDEITSSRAENVVEDLLVVCVEPRLSIKLGSALSELPYNVLMFRSSEAAMDLLCEKSAAALILLSPIDEQPAWDLISEFRSKSKKQPILLLSQNGAFLDHRSLNEYGINRVFEPPFDLEAIQRELAALLTTGANS